MIRSQIKMFAIAVVSLLVARMVFTRTEFQVTFWILGIATALIVWGATWKYNPRGKFVWIFFGLTSFFFAVSFGLRLFWPETMAPVASGQAQLSDWVDAIAFTCAIIGMHRMGQIRDDSSDPTNLVDSVIVAGGLSTIIWIGQLAPILGNDSIAASGRASGILNSTLSIGLAFCAIRISLTSTLKNSSSSKLSISAIFAVATEMAAVSTRVTMRTELFMLGIVGLVFLALCALDKSMVELTAPRPARAIPVSLMTRGRLFLMTAALAIAPVGLFFEIFTGGEIRLVGTCLIVSWVITTTFVMIRLAGLVRARERVSRAERTLSKAASALVACGDVHETYRCTVAAMHELASDFSFATRSIVAIEENGKWNVAATLTTSAPDGRPGLLTEADMELIAASVKADSECVEVTISDGRVVSIYSQLLFSQDAPRGALIFAAKTPLFGLATSSLSALASSVSLALEAAELARDLDQQRSERRFRSLVERSPDLIFVVDADDMTNFMSPATERIFGDVGRDLRSILSTLHAEDRDPVAHLINESRFNETRAIEFRVGDDEALRWFEATASNLSDDEDVMGVVVNARDITERKRLEHNLRHRVLHDELTGIANRVLYRERLDHALAARSSSESAEVAALFIDLDDFKTVNDGLGHDIGDELLKIIAFRLETTIREGDTAARLGGDEFAVLLEGLPTAEDVMALAGRILDALTEPVQFGDRELNVGASIGVALAERGESSEVVIRNADVAMYHAKQTGKSRIKLFDQDMYISAFKRLELKGELVHALERNELAVAYQPIMSMDNQTLHGFEALLRWNHPAQGMVSPASFIPLAEEIGLIVPFGEWVLRTAVEQLSVWQEEFGIDLVMSVNVSPHQLDNSHIVGVVNAAIADFGIEPHSLMLELTESAGLEDAEGQERLKALRALGCQIAADDFGTGFASYAALQQLPFTNVKIDRSLIEGLSSTDDRASAQVGSIIDMAHALGLTVTAEGIEDSVQSEALIAMGVDFGQGYLFGRPSSGANAAEAVRAQAQAITQS